MVTLMRQLRNILSGKLSAALLAGLLLCMPALGWGDSLGKSSAFEVQATNSGLNNESSEDGLYEQTIHSSDEAIKINPRNAEAWYKKGTALYYLGKYEEALQAYDQAIKIKPQYARAWGNKGVALRALGRTAEAETAFTKVKELRSSKSEMQAAQEMNASPAIAWQKCLGGNGLDSASDVQQTSDGGYIIAGYTDSNDGDVKGYHKGSYAWIVKLDKTGAIQWQKCLGGTGADEASGIQQTTDGGYIVAGSTSSTDGDVKGYHSKSGKLMLGGSVIDINLGGGDVWVVKLDKNGAMQWQNCLGGTGADEASGIQQTTDGGYIVAGSTGSTDGDVKGYHEGNDAWVIKLDKSGTMQWQKCLGGTGADEASGIQQTTDGGYIVAGYTESTDGDANGNHGGIDAWVIKLDKTGAIQWQKCLGGGNLEKVRSIQQTTDGGYVVAGYTYSYGDRKSVV
jgi:soluble cytochrome b562